MTVSRRELLAFAGSAPLAPRPPRHVARPRIAVLCTVFFKHSDTQQIVDRLLDGYGWQGAHHHPAVDIVALYVDQPSSSALATERTRRHPHMRLVPTIAEALLEGRNTLAVDGVVIVAEQGRYPKNDRGQILYPRYEFFNEVVKIFRLCERTVPVFIDKHLSWSWERARDMYDDAAAMAIPLMAGSHLPVAARLPAMDIPFGADLREALCIGHGPVDGHDFHAFEAMAAMVERRRGGERGVRRIQAFSGEAFFRAHEDGLWSRDLMRAALCRSLTLTAPPPAAEGDDDETAPWRRNLRDPVAYHFEYTDGLRGTVLMCNGLVSDFTFAASVQGRRDHLSTLFHFGTPPDNGSLANHFNPLVNHLETFLQSGRSPYPVERTLLTTGLCAEALESRHHNGEQLLTPHLEDIVYSAPRASTYWRG